MTDATEWTPDQIEAVFHAALSKGDIKGVDAALRLLAAKDPRRAQRLYDSLATALEVARLQGIGGRRGR